MAVRRFFDAGVRKEHVHVQQFVHIRGLKAAMKKKSPQEKCTYVFSTCVAVLCVKGLEAVAAVWPSVLHDVALAAQGGLALVAAEVLHVPVPALRFSAFIGKYDLCGADITLISGGSLHRVSVGLNRVQELM